ncbi:MAG TPA: amino acid adenylation protein, partial [Corynebacterium sp.]|uniref:Pls/PosA family non-ribosomal peptide synthetase n=1 Tax=Corynebacterium sp. TaxID=1720 RepID=UPI001854E497|nr:amino acid adenylation protein [Corynebacterium sp.]
GAASATTWPGAIGLALAWTAPAAIAAVAVYALLTLILVRLLSIGLKAGVHPVRSRVGWQAWATERLMDAARTDLFPLYASQLTPWWLRALGAKVGRDAEISTAVVLPKFTDIREGSFLADDTMVGGYELGGGWLLLEETRIGRRSFLGNSGIAGPGRKLGKNSLVAVLSSTPKKAKAGSNWWGSPPERLRRVAVEVDGGEDLTYRPGAGVKAARGAVETLRLLAPITSLALALLVLLAMQGAAVGITALADGMVGVDDDVLLATVLGLAAAWFVGSPVLLIAGMLAMLITVAMKWICVGTHEKGEHALWSRFVWLDELQDTFVETVAAPWYLVPGTGTGGLNRAMRWLGADVGHGAWLESYWLPETDLCRIGEGATVGRGCVVQTHLFQDRVMSLDTVELAPGATLGPHSVALPASRLGESTTIGPASLVMRGDVVPAGTRWQGNPIEPVKE